MTTHVVVLDSCQRSQYEASSSDSPEPERRPESREVTKISSVAPSILGWLQLVGIYLPASGTASAEVGSLRSERRRKTAVLGALWCVLANTCHVLNATRFLVYFAASSRQFSDNLSQFALAYMYTVIVFFNFAAIRSLRRIPSLVKDFDSYFDEHGQATSTFKQLKFYRTLCIAVATLGLSSVGGTVVWFAEFSTDFQWIITPFENTSGLPRIFSILGAAVLEFMNMAQFVYEFLVFTLFSGMLGRELARFSQMMNTHLEEVIRQEDLEVRRLRFERLISLLAEMDSIFSPFLAKTYLICYPFLIIAAYGISTGSLGLIQSTVFVVFAWMMFGATVGATLTAVGVNYHVSTTTLTTFSGRLPGADAESALRSCSPPLSPPPPRAC